MIAMEVQSCPECGHELRSDHGEYYLKVSACDNCHDCHRENELTVPCPECDEIAAEKQEQARYRDL